MRQDIGLWPQQEDPKQSLHVWPSWQQTRFNRLPATINEVLCILHSPRSAQMLEPFMLEIRTAHLEAAITQV